MNDYIRKLYLNLILDNINRYFELSRTLDALSNNSFDNLLKMRKCRLTFDELLDRLYNFDTYSHKVLSNMRKYDWSTRQLWMTHNGRNHLKRVYSDIVKIKEHYYKEQAKKKMK